MQGGGAEPRFYGNATVFPIRGVCEVLTEDHERPSQEEKNEKKYLAFPIIKNPAQRYFQRPRGTSRVFIGFGDIFCSKTNGYWTENYGFQRKTSTLTSCSSELRRSFGMSRHVFNIRIARSREWEAPYSIIFTTLNRKK